MSDTAMDEISEIEKDKRFAHVLTDPKYRKLKRDDRKIKIDDRFKPMFTDKQFKLKYSVDKRGRPVKTTTNENLRRFYELSESENDSEADGNSKADDDITDDDDDDKKNLCDLDNRETGDLDSDESSKSDETADKKLKKLKLKSVSKKSEKNVLKREHIDSFSMEVSDSDKVASSKKQKKKSTEKLKKEAKLSDSDDESESEDLGSDLDYARGEGLASSSEDDESPEENNDIVEENSEDVHLWGELDRDAPLTDDATCRLAICNMDWDRIKASDLFVLFNSFKPDTGIVKSVGIYPSQYGLERMREEDRQGPAELVEKTLDDSEEVEDSKEGEEYHREKLRKYQLNRLRYYYAILECDSPETADKIYTSCNGLEYESSATTFDLRFIPDGMEFDHEPTSICNTLPVKGSYKPSLFTNTALHQSNVTLTWDETPVDRIAVTMRNFSQEELEDMDVKDYLASDNSDEDDLKTILKENTERVSTVNEDDDIEVQIKKYKDLLKEIDEENTKKDDFHMEISWEPGLKETTEKLVKKKRRNEDLTPWEKYLEKKKDKKRQKRENKRKGGKEVLASSSEDDIPAGVDLNDPYFADELSLTSEKSKTKEKKEKKKTKKKKETFEISENEKAELELLVMDEKSLKKLKKEPDDRESKRKQRKKKKKNKEDNLSTAKITDPRFNEIYQDPSYNIDPSAPEFSKKKKVPTATLR